MHGYLRRRVEGATGYGISHNIRDAYEFLAANYGKGDDIFLFGFSRGAYTVRSLAGLIGEVGLLVPEATHLIPRLYRAYQRRSLRRFQEEYGDVLQDIQDTTRTELGVLPIRFLGVWDTVGALGAPTPLLKWITKPMGWVSFHNTTLGKTVHYAYQALALHELRRDFEPAIWTERGPATRGIEQVWFAGAHSDVGGGYEERGLSNESLRWMMAWAKEHELVFREAPAEANGDPSERAHLSRTALYKSAARLVRPIGPTYLTEQKRKSLCELKDASVERYVAAGPDSRDQCFGVIDELSRRLRTVAQKVAWSTLEGEIEADIKMEEYARELEKVLGPSGAKLADDGPGGARERFKRLWNSAEPKDTDRQGT